jgi:hypothetical protein
VGDGGASQDLLIPQVSSGEVEIISNERLQRSALCQATQTQLP